MTKLTPVHTKIIGGREFAYGWARYNTSIGNREREFYRIDGKRVAAKVFWAAWRDAKAVEEINAETGA